MSWQFSIFGLIFLFVTFIAIRVTVQAKRRSLPGDSYFVLFMASAAFWALTSALEWFVALPDDKAFWSRMSYFGIVNIAPSWFCFSLAYCKHEQLLTKRTVVLLWIIPVVALVLALSNAQHGWNWPSYRLVQHPLGNYMYYEHGPSFWMLAAYSYFLNIISSILLLKQFGKLFRLHQMQSLILMAGVMMPWIGNILYNTRAVIIVDLTPAAFTLTGILLWWNMKEFHLFDIAPVAREALFTNIKESVIVLDPQDRIIDMNAFAQSHFGMASIPIGKSAVKEFRQWPQLLSFIAARSIMSVEAQFELKEQQQWFHLTKTYLGESQQESAGMLIICRDITEQKLAQLEREQLINELRGALVNIKTLSGLLPICATCKKIRNDAGYWQQVEGYISEHTQAEFTHGICPECAQKALAEYERKKKMLGQSGTWIDE